MNPQEVLEFLCAIPDEALVGLAQQECVQFADNFAAGDPEIINADVMLAQMIHAALTWRGMVVEALDMFTRINAIHPLIPGKSYTEYVEFVESQNPFSN